MCAAWRRGRALPFLQAAFVTGERGITRAIRHAAVCEVDVSATAMMNVNTPADLAVVLTTDTAGRG